MSSICPFDTIVSLVHTLFLDHPRPAWQLQGTTSHVIWQRTRIERQQTSKSWVTLNYISQHGLSFGSCPYVCMQQLHQHVLQHSAMAMMTIKSRRGHGSHAGKAFEVEYAIVCCSMRHEIAEQDPDTIAPGQDSLLTGTTVSLRGAPDCASAA